MNQSARHLELIAAAQRGSQESMNRLAELVRGRLSTYLYRLTLDADLAQDLTQETLLEMVKSLKGLRFPHVNFFWSWLFRTGLSKVQRHARDRRRRLSRPVGNGQEILQHTAGKERDGLTHVMRRELSAAVFEAIGKLKLRHRNVLILRCYEQMPYAQIAGEMNCSELQVRALFFRAKHSLKRQLNQRGFKQKYLLTALGLFAGMTASPSRAGAAVAVTAASTSVGLVAALLGVATTKLGMATMAAVVLLVLGLTGVVPFVDAGIGSAAWRSPAGGRAAPVTGCCTIGYPMRMVDANDSGGDGWKRLSRGDEGQRPAPVAPEDILIGRADSQRPRLILAPSDAVEVAFRNPIIHCPHCAGVDLMITGRLDAGQPQVWITDAAGQQQRLRTPTMNQHDGDGTFRIGFDLADVALAFTPQAIRVAAPRGSARPSDLAIESISARIVP